MNELEPKRYVPALGFHWLTICQQIDTCDNDLLARRYASTYSYGIGAEFQEFNSSAMHFSITSDHPHLRLVSGLQQSGGGQADDLLAIKLDASYDDRTEAHLRRGREQGNPHLKGTGGTICFG